MSVLIQEVNGERAAAGRNRQLARVAGAVLLFLFLLPYVVTSFFGNVGDAGAGGMVSRTLAGWEKELAGGSIYAENITEVGRERIPLEIYLLDKLARSIHADYHVEALKAQAVLLRTALVEELWKNSGSIRGIVRVNEPEYGRGIINEDVIMAVVSTQGVILTYEEGPAKVAYFAVSNGRTRDSSEAFGQGGLPYFQPVDCNRDFLAENFTSQQTMSKSEFITLIEKAAMGASVSDSVEINDLHINRDSSGYIIDITVPASPAPVRLSGEECRFLWGLNSSCFSIEEGKGKIIFSVRGIGHGLGMSQYAANEMAKSENDYIDILEYFFSGLMLNKFE